MFNKLQFGIQSQTKVLEDFYLLQMLCAYITLKLVGYPYSGAKFPQNIPLFTGTYAVCRPLWNALCT